MPKWKPAAIVSGGCQGIGLAVCRRILPEWDVVIVDVQQGSDIAADLERESGGKVVAYRADIGDEDAVREIFSRVAADFPQAVRGLVNSAGIYSDAAPGHGSDDDELRLFRVNVLGTQHMVNRAVPLMAKAGSGSIVTLASVAGRMGADAAAEAYTGSKSDLIGRSKQWAKVYGPCGVRSNVVAPGPVNTGMIGSWTPARRQAFIEKTPLRRMAEPEDIADVVWFLLSDLSRHVTGVCLDVNGGYYIAP
jgi:3-oxoacyl-[acyl-carrier protein] reductase